MKYAISMQQHILFSMMFLISQMVNADTNTVGHNWGVLVRGGIAPTLWVDRNNFTAVSCNATSVLALPSAIIPLFKMPQFHNLFTTPWLVGIQISLAGAPELEYYLECNYRQAHSRTFTLSNLVIPNIDTITFSLIPQNNYKVFDAYMGIHYHWIDWFRQTDIIVGAKVGLLHHQKINFVFSTDSLTVPFPAPFVSDRLIFSRSNTVLAGGITIGAALAIGCNCSLWLTGEVVAGCAPWPHQNIPFNFPTQSVEINPVLAPNSFLIGTLGNELFFPITIGFRYNF